jgi:hypothetical protein
VTIRPAHALLKGAWLWAALAAGSSGLGDEISALNYHLCSTLRSNATYTGVVVNLQPVKVSSGRSGLVPALVTGIVDAVVGSRLSVVSQPACQYTIQLDAILRPNGVRFVTVVQGPENPIALGQPVLLIAERVGYHEIEVRLTPFHPPPW